MALMLNHRGDAYWKKVGGEMHRAWSSCDDWITLKEEEFEIKDPDKTVTISESDFEKAFKKCFSYGTAEEALRLKKELFNVPR